MDAKLKILLVSPYLPASDTTGCARQIHDFIRALSQKGHQVYLLSFCSQEDKGRVPLISRFCREVHLEYLDNYYRFPARAPVFKKIISELSQSKTVDIVQCENSYLKRYVPVGLGIPLVLVEHEILSVAFRQQAGLQDNYFGKIILFSRAIKKTWQEQRWYRGFDRIIVFTQADRQAIISRIKSADPAVIPIGINAAEYPPAVLTAPAFDLIFAGNFSHAPNIDAALYFSRQILPLIKQKLPEVKILIAGANPPEAVRNLAKIDPCVTVTGYVPDIKSLYAKSKVSIAPLRWGSGMCFKILEALALQTAVVATSTGARGITLPKIIKIADGELAFAQAAIDLLKDDNLRQAPVAAGRAAVEGFYDWGSLISKYEEVYSRLLYH